MTDCMCPRLERRSIGRFFLIVTLLSGWAVRLFGLNWDQGQGLHPDERYIAWVASSVSLPDAMGDAFNPQQSRLNPFVWPSEQAGGPDNGNPVGSATPRTREFSYGHFPLYLMTLVSGGDADEARLALVGRVLSALFDTATILMVFALGRLLYSGSIGILAALLITFTVTHVQQAHFATVDATLTCFVVATLLFAVRFVRFGRMRDAVAACLFLGLAVGTKFSAILLLAPLGVTLMLARAEFGWPARQTLALALIGCGVALAVFALTNPFALLQAGEFVDNLQQQGAMLRGDDAFPFTLQYRGTRPYLYPIEQQLRWGMGLPLGLVAVVGVAYAVFCALRRPMEIGIWPLLTWVILYFGIYGSLHVKFMRYMLPLLPILAVFASALLLGGAHRYTVPRIHSQGRDSYTPLQVRAWSFFPKTRAKATVALITAVVLMSLFHTLAFLNVYRGEHPWLAFSRWFYRYVPAGARILNESWDHHLPLTFVEEGTTWWPGIYKSQSIDPYAPETPEKLREMLTQLAASDYLIIASNRLYGSTTRAPERYPLMVLYYELLFEGRLGYKVVPAADIERHLRLGWLALLDDPYQAAGLPTPLPIEMESYAPLELVLGRADESFTVYDHPRPMLFRNVDRLPAGEMVEYFGDLDSGNDGSR